MWRPGQSTQPLCWGRVFSYSLNHCGSVYCTDAYPRPPAGSQAWTPSTQTQAGFPGAAQSQLGPSNLRAERGGTPGDSCLFSLESAQTGRSAPGPETTRPSLPRLPPKSLVSDVGTGQPRAALASLDIKSSGTRGPDPAHAPVC